MFTKKMIGAAMAIVTAAGLVAPMATPANAASANTFYYGDVNNDGKVESEDARYILRSSVKLETPNGLKGNRVDKYQSGIPTQAQLADVDSDGVISASDARSALRMSVRLDPMKSIQVKSEKPMTTEEKLQKFIDENMQDMVSSTGRLYAKDNKIIYEESLDVPDTFIPLVKTMAKAEFDKMGMPDGMEDALKNLRAETGDNSVCFVIRLATDSGNVILEKTFR